MKYIPDITTIKSGKNGPDIKAGGKKIIAYCNIFWFILFLSCTVNVCKLENFNKKSDNY